MLSNGEEGNVSRWPADFPCTVTNLWLPDDHFVGKLLGQPTRPTQPSILPGW